MDLRQGLKINNVKDKKNKITKKNYEYSIIEMLLSTMKAKWTNKCNTIFTKLGYIIITIIIITRILRKRQMEGQG